MKRRITRIIRIRGISVLITGLILVSLSTVTENPFSMLLIILGFALSIFGVLELASKYMHFRF
ncbi:hypothetical protein KAS14_00930 [Candidatus Bathyarchaeota archaeon]|nr:hypothetical protein [Candidatus Bathyarchaeota archaeon]